MKAVEYTYTVLFEPAEEGGYVVTCPALPGLVTGGDSLDEAREMAADAIRCYIQSLQMDGLPIPPGEEHEAEPLRDKVSVQLKAV